MVVQHFAFVDTVHCVEIILKLGLGIGLSLLSALDLLAVDDKDAAQDHQQSQDGGQHHHQGHVTA